MSSPSESASLKSQYCGNEQIFESGSSKKLRVQKIPVTFVDDIMLDFLKFLSWKAINKLQRVDSKWFELIKREKVKEKSTLPSQLVEHFEMGLAKVPRTFNGNKQDRSIIRLGITVREEGEEDERIFSWKFDNNIRNYFWAHLEHWFKHLREPFGVIKAVTLVPFDLVMWETMEKNNPYLVKKIYAETLKINCVLVKGNEFEWVLNFSQKYCSAKKLIWRIEKNGDDGVDMDDEHVRLNDIINFVETQGHNFAELSIYFRLVTLDINDFASDVVKMFQNHANPSKLMKEVLIDCEGDFIYMDSVALTFPISTIPTTVFIRATFKYAKCESCLESITRKRNAKLERLEQSNMTKAVRDLVLVFNPLYPEEEKDRASFYGSVLAGS